MPKQLSVSVRNGQPAAKPEPSGTETGTPPARRSLHPLGLAMLLVVLVGAVYFPALRNGFVAIDDREYVLANSHVLQGVTWENVTWAFRTTHMGNWHPLTWLSHQLDAEWYGTKPAGHHLTSLVLHALNAGLVFLVLLKMTGAVWRSWLVAALFGLHPLHVESVAWVAERKDVLSTLWWILAIWSYVHWCQARDSNGARMARYYGISLLCFVAGLMSKPMVVTLPCVLLLLDYWPLRRWGAVAPTGGQPGEFRARLVEKIPFFLLSAATSVITMIAQENVGAMSNLERLPWDYRVINAVISYTEYLRKFLYPADLAALYPFPDKPSLVHAMLSGMVLVAVTVGAWLLRRTRPYLLIGWLAYLGMLVPVIGLIQVGPQALADRYTYVPLLGIFVALIWGVADLSRGWRRRFLPGGMTVAMLALLAMLTMRQLQHWRDGEALARRALAVTERNWIAHLMLGYVCAQNPERIDEAIEEFRTVCRLVPNHADPHMALVTLLAKKPDAQAEAMAEARIAMELKPGSAWGYFTQGKSLRDIAGKHEEAAQRLAEAARLAPENGEYELELAATLALLPERAAEAVAAYRRAILLLPDRVEIRNDLGNVLIRMPGLLDEAIAEYQFVIQARPDFADAHNNLANVLRRTPGREQEAIAAYQAALRLRPASLEIEYNLATMLVQISGHEREALAHFEAILSRMPGWKPALEMKQYLQAKGF